MPVLKYWDASQGAYVPLAGIGAQGPQGSSAALYSNRLFTAGGECLVDRTLYSSAGLAPGSTGRLYLMGFIALRTETITQIVMYCSGTAAAATPTLIRMAIYGFDTSGNATLLSATANDTSLFSTTYTKYQRTLTPSFNKVAGVNYAAGLLVNSAVALPTICVGAGVNAGGIGAYAASEKALPIGIILAQTGLSDLPASMTYASMLGNPGINAITELLP